MDISCLGQHLGFLNIFKGKCYWYFSRSVSYEGCLLLLFKSMFSAASTEKLQPRKLYFLCYWVQQAFPRPLSPGPVQQWAHVFSCFPSMLIYLEKPVLLPFMSAVTFNCRWALAFLTPSLQTWTVFLFSSRVTFLCFCILHALSLWVNLGRSILFIHVGLLLPLLDFLLTEMDHSQTWRWWSLKMRQGSWWKRIQILTVKC